MPGRYRCGLLTAPGRAARAAFVTSCFLGDFPPVVDFRAVCFVRAMLILVSGGALRGNLGGVCMRRGGRGEGEPMSAFILV